MRDSGSSRRRERGERLIDDRMKEHGVRLENMKIG
jgi:hypothetical protein